MKKIDFFIVGSPKCGTTALSSYLSENPEVCFSRPKEPHYFCDDFTNFGFKGSLKEYYSYYFSHYRDHHTAIGEGSVWYLYSKVAISNIMKYNNEAKIIVMLRNPVEMVYSLYYQQVFSFDEDVKTFNDAWNLQDKRSKGKSVPAKCREQSHLLYKDVGNYSIQLKRLYKHVPRKQVRVILFDDFISETQKVYCETLDFLNISSDGRTRFPRVNQNKIHKSEIIGKAFKKNPRFVRNAAQKIKGKLNIKSFYILTTLAKLNSKKVSRPPLDDNTRRILIDQFNDEIHELSQILNKDLEHWLTI